MLLTMKKFLLLVFVAMAAISVPKLFAQEQDEFRYPSAQDLAEFNTIDNAVLCISLWDEVCNDIVVPGSYNGWATDDVAALIHMKPLEGFEHWYVAEIPFMENLEVKIVQLANDGSFNWDLQASQKNGDWMYIDGRAIALARNGVDGFNLKLQEPGAYIYECANWNFSPCGSEYDWIADVIICIFALLLLVAIICGIKLRNNKQGYNALLSIAGGVVAALLIVAVWFKYLHWPGGNMLLFYSMCFIICFCCLAIAGVAKHSHLAELAAQGIASAKCMRCLWITILAVAIILCIGILFKIMHWPGASFIILIASCILAILAIVAGSCGSKMLKQ